MASDNIKKLKELTLKLNDSEHEIAAQKKVLEFILENSTDGYWDWQIDKDYEYLSKTFKKQLGYEENELENHPSSWQKLIHPEDLIKLKEELDKHFKTQGSETFEVESRYTHKQGHTINILCKGKIIDWDDNGNPIRMVGTHIDITKLKK